MCVPRSSSFPVSGFIKAEDNRRPPPPKHIVLPQRTNCEVFSHYSLEEFMEDYVISLLSVRQTLLMKSSESVVFSTVKF